MGKLGGNHPSVTVGFSFFFNFKFLLLKFIYHNSMYTELCLNLSSVLKGGKSGKQVAKQ